jgi:hypothetical protein
MHKGNLEPVTLGHPRNAVNRLEQIIREVAPSQQDKHMVLFEQGVFQDGANHIHGRVGDDLVNFLIACLQCLM